MSKLNLIGVASNGTQVFEHPEAHPHRMDLAAEAISKMVIPERPADPTDRNQTRVSATIDLGYTIGVNHLVETDKYDTIVMFDRGRGYKSRMVLKEAEDETKVTSVCFWDADNDCWVLWTNFEGEEGLPEPGCDRYNKAPIDFQNECDNFWANHALVPTEEELEQIEIGNAEIALAILRMLVDEMDLDFHEQTEVYYASESDVIDSWKYEVIYADGSHRLEPINTVNEIRKRIDWHIDGYSCNPDGYDY